MEVSTPISSSPGPSTVDSSLSSSTIGSEDAASTSAREWKRLFGQMQSSQPSASSSSRSTTRSTAADVSVSSRHVSTRGRGSAARPPASSTRGGRAQASRRLLDSPGSTTVSLPPAPSDPLSRIRHKIVTTPLPPDTVLTATNTTYRSVVWKLLLDIRELDVASYFSLVAKGKSPSHDKIRNDTFRTLATDQGFKERVKEEKLIRLLDAFVWKYHRSDDSDDDADADGGAGVYEFSYVQGMNVLAAPFLYTLQSEVEAFRCFSRFIEYCCPLYVQPTLAGVHRGLQVSITSSYSQVSVAVLLIHALTCCPASLWIVARSVPGDP